MFVPAALATAVIAQIGRAATSMLGGPQASSAAVLDFAVAIPMIIGGLMFSAAVLRKAVRDEFIGPIGLTLGRDEMRLLGVGASATLLSIPIFLVLMMVLSATVMRSLASSPEALEALAADPDAMLKAIVEALGPVGIGVMALLFLIVFSIATGFVALANAATTGAKRIMLFQAWSWIGGNVSRVLLAFVLTAAPVIIVNAIIAETIATVFFSLTGDSASLLPYLLVLTLITFLNALFSLPSIALGAILYKGLRPADVVAN